MTWVCEVHGAGGRSWVGMVLHAARVALTEGATCGSRRKVYAAFEKREESK